MLLISFENIKKLLIVLAITIITLTSHIYISEWADFKTSVLKGAPYTQQKYPQAVLFASYITAFIQIGLLVFLYQHTSHLLIAKSRILKSLIIAFIMLVMKGHFRGVVMNLMLNYMMTTENYLILVSLNYLDPLCSNLIFSFCLVFLCDRNK